VSVIIGTCVGCTECSVGVVVPCGACGMGVAETHCRRCCIRLQTEKKSMVGYQAMLYRVSIRRWLRHGRAWNVVNCLSLVLAMLRNRSCFEIGSHCRIFGCWFVCVVAVRVF
jgi:hypothetical protein